MYRTIYPEAPDVHHSWYKNKNQFIRRRTLEKCQCFRFHYRHHWGWFKKSVGLILVGLSILILVWSEKRAVQNSKSYHEGLKALTVLSDPHEILPENEGKLIHLAGYLTIYEPLEDLPYGVSIYAVKLKRRVQMYQWIEEKNSDENDFKASEGSHRYRKAWKDKLSDSSKFTSPQNHENPVSFPVSSEIRINPSVYLGKFRLGPELKDTFTSFIQFTSGERPEVGEIKMHMGLYYHSPDIWNPAVGDIRIQFSFAGPANLYVSVIAMQVGDELRPYTTESGAEIAFLHEGKKQHMDIFNKEHSTVTVESWMYRISAYVVTVFGTYMASRIIALINRRNKVVKNLMSMGPQKFSIITAAFLSLSVIGCVWMSHKPIFGFLSVTFSCSLILYYALVGAAECSSSRAALPQYSQLY